MRLLAILLILLTTALRAAEITLAAEPICPYICADHKSGRLQSPPGVVIEIVRDALALHGHLLRYKMRPLARAISEVRMGRLDATLIWEENAPDFILPEEAVVTVDTCFFARSGSDWRYLGIESLEDQRLGIILGDHPPLPGMEEYLLRHSDDEFVQSAVGSDATEINIRKLLAGRIDLFFDEKNLALYRLRTQDKLNRVKIADCPSPGQPVYLAFSPNREKSALFARQLSQGIRSLRASGRIAQILSHYGISEADRE